MDIMSAEGVGALTVSEIARRTGMRAPSLYKYFPSRTAIYDLLFARAARAHLTALTAATADLEPGIATLRGFAEETVRWAVAHPALAQLLFSRPVPGYTPSPEAFAEAEAGMRRLHAEAENARGRGEFAAGCDLGEFAALFTVTLSGLIHQQLANEPDVGYADGRFSSLTPRATEYLLAAYLPRSSPCASNSTTTK